MHGERVKEKENTMVLSREPTKCKELWKYGWGKQGRPYTCRVEAEKQNEGMESK